MIYKCTTKSRKKLKMSYPTRETGIKHNCVRALRKEKGVFLFASLFKNRSRASEIWFLHMHVLAFNAFNLNF